MSMSYQTACFLAPLVSLPKVITRTGRYMTRAGDEVTVETRGPYMCDGYYDDSGIRESWHQSGRILSSRTTPNDIVKEIK